MSGREEKLGRMRLRVVGRVQGVGFRYYIQRRAASCLLRGWVRNEDDGSVILVAEGQYPLLDELRHAAATGPPGARVDSVLEEPVEDSEDLPPFEVRHIGW